MRLAPLILAVACLQARPLIGQQPGSVGEVFLARELATPPRLQASPMRYHPKEAFSRSVKVRIQFVVDTTGAPEPRTMRVTNAPDSAFAVAARLTVLAREYRPWYFRGTAVRVLVEDTLRFKGDDVRCDDLIASHGTTLCVDTLATTH